MIRIGRGKWKGHILRPSRTLCRPTSSLVRCALFDIAGGELVNSTVFWDLCAGSGAVGLEALSRGSAHCLFVDSNPGSVSFIRRFLTDREALDEATLVTADVRRFVHRELERPSIVFIDPPYRSAKLYRWVDGVKWSSILREGGMVFVERAAADDPKEGWSARKYGDTLLTWVMIQEMT